MAKQSRPSDPKRADRRRPETNPLRVWGFRGSVEGLENRRLLSSINEFGAQALLTNLAGITLGPGGNYWVAEQGASQGGAIDEVTPSGGLNRFTLGITAGSEPTGIAYGSDGNIWFTEMGAAQIGRITPTGTITEFSTGITSASAPDGITPGPDGALWFTESAAGKIGRISTAGVVTESTIPSTNSRPVGIVTGSDGNLWFTESGAEKIGQITPLGQITEFSTGLSSNAVPMGITAGPDGNLWFAESGDDKIGQITTSGSITEFSQGITAGSMPTGITKGPDGNLYFTEQAGNQIGRITTSGVVTEFTGDLDAGAGPTGIVAGSDGSLGVTESRANKIDRVTTTGVATSLVAPNFIEPRGITQGPDGNLWAVDEVSRIDRITPTGSVTDFTEGLSSNASPYDITTGPDGNLWFTEFNAGKIGRITPAGVITEFANNGLSFGLAPAAITAGADGNLWFTINNSGQIGRITPAGVITLFSNLSGAAGGIASGRDGNLWFTEPSTSMIGRITPSGVITQFSTGITSNSEPTAITQGPDGNLWFTEPNIEKIGRITDLVSTLPVGTVTEFATGLGNPTSLPAITSGPGNNLYFLTDNGTSQFTSDIIGQISTAGNVSLLPLPSIIPNSNDFGITAGPDGNLWVTSQNLGQVLQVTTTGNVLAEIPPQGAMSTVPEPTGVVAGPDGNLWFADFQHAITRIDTSGHITDFINGLTQGINTSRIANGSDGNLWFTEKGADVNGNQINKIGRITPQGVITEFSNGITSNAGVGDITEGPDGNLWFTEQNVGKIGMITTQGVVTEFPVNFNPTAITTGPDHNLWFTSSFTNKIGMITTLGAESDFTIPSNGADANSITSGPGNALYFTELNQQNIGRITTAGVITETPVPTPVAGSTFGLSTIDSGPDQLIYFLESAPSTSSSSADFVARMNANGSFSTFPIPHIGSDPLGIAFGSDQNLWFGEAGGNQIGQLALSEGITNATGVPASVVATLPSTFEIATFQDTSTATNASNFTATINYGDNTSGPATIQPYVLNGVVVPGKFEVFGSHTYTLVGPYHGQVTIGTETGTIAPVAVTITSTSPINLAAFPIDGLTGRRSNTLLATLVESDPTATPADFTATVNWGDGTPDSSAIVAEPAGGSDNVFNVYGGHDYTSAGSDTFTVTVLDTRNNLTATSTASATIEAAPAQSIFNEIGPNSLTPGAGATGITMVPGGDLWFTETNSGRIGRIDTSGNVTEFSPSNGNGSGTPGFTTWSHPTGITYGPDGALWFTESGLDQVARITTSGVVTEFGNGITPGSAPNAIASVPNGDLWFTEPGVNKIARITTSGVVTEFSANLPANFDPDSITFGPDGNLWFVGLGSNMVGRITQQGTISLFSGATGSGLTSITLGSDHNLWFTENTTSQIGQITTSGVVTEFTGAAIIGPSEITPGPDGNLWFTENADPPQGVLPMIGRITTSGLSSVFMTGLTPNSQPAGIVAGPDDNLYFVETDGDRIGQVVLPQTSVASAMTTTPPSPSVGQSFSATLATFLDNSSVANLTNFQGMINWGDTTSSPASITKATGQPFSIAGTHAYATSGIFHGSITIQNAADSAPPLPFSIIVASAPTITVTGKNVTAYVNQSITEAVASFTNSTGTLPSGSYQATINWGDQTTTTGVIGTQSGGENVVVGSHTYLTVGTFRITTTVQVISTPTESGSGTSQASITPFVSEVAVTGLDISTQANRPITAPVAYFTDSGGPRPSGSYQLTIYWGDNTFSNGTEGVYSNGDPDVIGTHTYARAGTYPITTKVEVITSPMELGSGTSQATVTPFVSEVSVTGLGITAQANQSITEPVAYFNDSAGTRPSGSYRLTINWGDNTISTGTQGVYSNGDPDVIGTHTYASAGTYSITTTVQVIASPLETGTGTSLATVSPFVSELTASGVNIYATESHVFNGIVASFTDSGSSSSTTRTYAAMIDWGDGSTPTSGTIVSQGVADFTVEGSHPYVTLGQFSVHVQIQLVGRLDTAIADSTALVEVAGPIDEVKVGASSMPETITNGPDGNLWFTDPGSNSIDRLTTGGLVTSFDLSQSASGLPHVITSGPDGNLWFTEQGVAEIGRITTSGVVTEFNQGFTSGAVPVGITSGPDGALWFADSSGAIGRITTSGVVTEFNQGLVSGSSPGSITLGSDGNLWFTDEPSSTDSSIGRITPQGVITEFTIPTSNAGLASITSGPDGALWFTEKAAGKIGRITTSGAVTEFTNGLFSDSQPDGITSGPDGNLWFTDYSTNHADRITTSGDITTFAIPTSSSLPEGIVTGSDDNLWFTESASGQIGQVVTPESVIPNGVTLHGTAGTPLTGVYANFVDKSTLVSLPRFFTNAIAFGDGAYGAGSFDSSGNAISATHTYASSGDFTGQVTITDAVGTSDPAIIQANLPANPLTFVVTNTNDSGAGSLRQVILNANSVFGHAITFAIPGLGVETIAIKSPLPAIDEPTIIDGSSEAAFEGVTPAYPLVEIDGRMVGGSSTGLDFMANAIESTVEDLSIFGFGGPQIALEVGGVGIFGNFIGLRSDGTIPAYVSTAPNLATDGILVQAPDAIIGLLIPGQGNVISGNAGQGIELAGSSVTTVGIFGNIIGLDPSGTVARPNAINGIVVDQGAGDEFIGPANVVSGNGGDGIVVLASQGDLIDGNAIGTNRPGSHALGNGNDGVLIDQLSRNITIGGTVVGATNIISGNASTGITVQGGSSGVLIEDDLIGTDLLGKTALGNGIAGVLISDALDNVVGPGDLVSGNGSIAQGAGIWIDGPGSTGNLVFGDKIGTDLDGEAPLGNSVIGVLINEAAENAIGGNFFGATNVISGNAILGVMLAGQGSTANLVDGNLIGTDLLGQKAIGNGSPTEGDGLYLENAPGNFIGGPMSGMGNLISGNHFDGVELFGPGSLGNLVQENMIGTDLSGNRPLGNGNDGLVIDGSPGSIIVANIDSANTHNGITISGSGATKTVIEANMIGRGLGGQALGNGSFGLLIINGAPEPIQIGNDLVNNTLGPIRDTNIAPAAPPTASAGSKSKATSKKLQVKASSFGSRPLTTLQTRGDSKPKAHPSTSWRS